jgi:DNA-3-methyladenine glycosylase I
MPGKKETTAAPRTETAHEDGLIRCPWVTSDPIYIAYHDHEWGAPEYDDRALFEKLLLDCFQAGLSWITILRKRKAFRAAFEGFDPERMARYTARDVERLMNDAGIVRNRAKIEGAVASARAYLALRDKQGLSRLLWDRIEGRPIQNRFERIGQAPTETPLSRELAKELKALGFAFCGPTIVYAFMQAVGMVNDHLVACCRHEACRELGKTPR